MHRTILLLSRSIIFVSIIVFVAHTANTLLYYYPLYLPSSGDVKSAIAEWMDVVYNKQAIQVAASEQSEPVTKPQAAAFGYPIIVHIERLGISLNIEPGYYDTATQTWTLSEGRAFYATLSDLPSSFNGNTIVYAHNQENAFLKTNELAIGDHIRIETTAGHTFVYEYVGDEDVYPEDDQVFAYKDYPRLTLLTCSGKLSETRRLMYARLISIESGKV